MLTKSTLIGDVAVAASLNGAGNTFGLVFVGEAGPGFALRAFFGHVAEGTVVHGAGHTVVF